MSLCLPFLFNIQCHQIISYFPAQAFILHIGGFNLMNLIGLAYRHMDYCLQGLHLAFGKSEQSTCTIYNFKKKNSLYRTLIIVLLLVIFSIIIF